MGLEMNAYHRARLSIVAGAMKQEKSGWNPAGRAIGPRPPATGLWNAALGHCRSTGRSYLAVNKKRPMTWPRRLLGTVSLRRGGSKPREEKTRTVFPKP